jgi:xanthine dehydrogenase YagS FAD-binding subunit
LNIGTVGGDLCQRPRCWYFRNGFGLLAKEGDFSLVPHGDNRYHAIFGNEGPAYFVSASSFGPPLIALGATVTLAGPNGSRTIPVAQFFRTPQSEKERETALKPNEILTQIDIPVRGLRNATYEVRHRHGLDWPYVTASVAYAAKGGSAAEAQIALGHVAPTPWLATAAARLLEGPLVDAALAAKCGQTATQGAKPLSRNAYKVQMVQTSVKRAILAAAGA